MTLSLMNPGQPAANLREQSSALKSAKLMIRHSVTFDYGGAVTKNRNQVRLRPASDSQQQCLSFELQIDPSGQVTEEQDQHGNRIHCFEIAEPHTSLMLNSRAVVSLAANPAKPLADSALTEIATHESLTEPEIACYLGSSPRIPHLPAAEQFVISAEQESHGSVQTFARAAANEIRRRFRYRAGVTEVSSSIADFIAAKAGVCQDFAHLLIAILRWRGIPARYVSGYLVPAYLTDPLYRGDRLFRSSGGHAWVEFFVLSSASSSSGGWIEIDPLEEAGQNFLIKTAHGRDYLDAAPVTGIYRGYAQSSVRCEIEIFPAEA